MVSQLLVIAVKTDTQLGALDQHLLIIAFVSTFSVFLSIMIQWSKQEDKDASTLHLI